MRVLVTVTGDDRVEHNLREIARRAKDARPATKVAREILQKGISEQFESRGSHFGTPWAPLASSTVEQKGNDVPLERTGALRSSLTGGRGKRSSATRKKATAGSSLFYARFAQAGTKKGEPARPLVGASTAERQAILAVVDQWVFHGRATTSVSF